MKKLLLLILPAFVLLDIATAHAADLVERTITGQVVDSLVQETVPYASLRIVPADDIQQIIKVFVSNENGNFSDTLNVSQGNYFLIVDYTGKKQRVIPFEAGETKTIDFGIIYLVDKIGTLSEVTVMALKPLIKMDLDKITYNVQDDPEAKTNNVLEMLKKTPLVTIDGEENIQLKGSQNFRIYLNGKPSNMLANNPKEVLRSMPANLVKNIEVITDPGAKYDAEGVVGIINIVTQSQTSLGGYMATINGGIDSRKGINTGIYAMAKYGKVGFTGNYNYSEYRNPLSKTGSLRESYIDDANKYLNQNGLYTYFGKSQFGSGEISYEMDTLNLLNIGFNRYQWDGENNLTSLVRMENAYWENVYEYENKGVNKNRNGSTGVNVDFQHTSEKVADRLLTGSYRFSFSPSNSNNENKIDCYAGIVLPVYIDDGTIRQFTDANTKEHTFQIDYTTPIQKIHTVELGAKYIIRINGSSSDYERELNGVVDNEYLPFGQSKYITQFENRNDILSAYSGYTLKLNNHWGFKSGLRYESTRLHVEYPLSVEHDFEVDYSNLVPSLSATYKIDNRQNFRLGYNMRISRPGIWQLNPYVDNSNPNYISHGNPELDAVKSHAISLNYGFFTPKINWNMNLSYNFENNGIELVTSEIKTGQQKGLSESTYENIGKSKRVNLSSYFNWSPTMKIRTFGNLYGSYANIQANNGSGMKNSGFYGQAFLGAQYQLPWNVWFTGFVGAGLMNVTLQMDGASYSYHSLGLRKMFLNDKINVQFTANNLFKDKYLHSNTTRTETYSQKADNEWRRREFRISISYRLGEMKTQIKKTKRGIANDDVISSEQNSNVSGGQSQGK